MNVKNELVNFLLEIYGLDYSDYVMCGIIIKEPSNSNEYSILKLGHTTIDFINFLNNLDFEYDDGYGTQELFGTIWLTDESWLTREEYDGSEWWKHNKRPDIPNELN